MSSATFLDYLLALAFVVALTGVGYWLRGVRSGEASAKSAGIQAHAPEGSQRINPPIEQRLSRVERHMVDDMFYERKIDRMRCEISDERELRIKAERRIRELEEAVLAALNIVDGDGAPPDWDHLRTLVKYQRTET